MPCVSFPPSARATGQLSYIPFSSLVQSTLDHASQTCRYVVRDRLSHCSLFPCQIEAWRLIKDLPMCCLGSALASLVEFMLGRASLSCRYIVRHCRHDTYTQVSLSASNLNVHHRPADMLSVIGSYISHLSIRFKLGRASQSLPICCQELPLSRVHMSACSISTRLD